MIERFRREADPSRMNVVCLGPTDLDEQTLRQQLLAAPFLGRKRMIVLNNCVLGSRRKAIHGILLSTAKETKDHTVLVFSEDSGMPKKWANEEAKVLWNYLIKHGSVEEFKTLWGARLEKEIVNQARERGLEIARDAVVLLSIMCASDLEQTEQEIQKLSAYCQGRPATTDDVKAVCIAQGEASIFGFLDCLGNKQQKALLGAMEEQLQELDTIALMARIVAHLRALLVVLLNGESGGRELRLHPFQLSKIQSQIRHWDSAELKRLLTKLTLLDFSIKRGLCSDPRPQLSVLLASI